MKKSQKKRNKTSNLLTYFNCLKTKSTKEGRHTLNVPSTETRHARPLARKIISNRRQREAVKTTIHFGEKLYESLYLTF
jgi:hypothetical protein